ncbi:hypothetical protein HK100_005783 [Physocladia obscura]|uniref:Uncharacterized protein n=1 Tax=Physocladia obscura TaxID=109957 RepID=A0AAD5T5U0_9FUNG|nr:hypothetical protein HK100_005783 [Physocladia obscura]
MSASPAYCPASSPPPPPPPPPLLLQVSASASISWRERELTEKPKEQQKEQQTQKHKQLELEKQSAAASFPPSASQIQTARLKLKPPRPASQSTPVQTRHDALFSELKIRVAAREQTVSASSSVSASKQPLQQQDKLQYKQPSREHSTADTTSSSSSPSATASIACKHPIQQQQNKQQCKQPQTQQHLIHLGQSLAVTPLQSITNPPNQTPVLPNITLTRRPSISDTASIATTATNNSNLDLELALLKQESLYVVQKIKEFEEELTLARSISSGSSNSGSNGSSSRGTCAASSTDNENDCPPSLLVRKVVKRRHAVDDDADSIRPDDLGARRRKLNDTTPRKIAARSKASNSASNSGGSGWSLSSSPAAFALVAAVSPVLGFLVGYAVGTGGVH